MRDVAALFAEARIVPVLTIERLDQAVPLAQALVSGGLRVLEITLRTPVALDCLRAIQREVPEAVAGIGTVLDPRELERVRICGAAFAVSPGTTPELLDAAREAKGLPFVPGTATPSEMMRAHAGGFTLLKFFPAEAAGGVAFLKSVLGPLPELRFCPTGGIGEERMRDYLDLPNVVAVGGTWMAPVAEIAAGAWSRIAERARAAREKAR
jgi:2-dehydro-3-deoxyphosphogluconate aldolase/(4S)-4-hydroxy-2-oxoglutarate aldolase